MPTSPDHTGFLCGRSARGFSDQPRDPHRADAVVRLFAGLANRAPTFVAFAVLASVGLAFLITALSVEYRDFRYVIPFIIQFWPVGFSSAVVPEGWRFSYSHNPVVGVIEGLRWWLLGGSSQLYSWFLLSLGVVTLVRWLGIAYFGSTEKSFDPI
jgi:lipopolysaccharide transport system permease protein